MEFNHAHGIYYFNSANLQAYGLCYNRLSLQIYDSGTPIVDSTVVQYYSIGGAKQWTSEQTLRN